MKKWSLSFFALVLVITIFVGCSGSKDAVPNDNATANKNIEEKPEKETVEIQWITHTAETPEDEDYTRNLITGFEEKNAGIKIKWMPNKDPDLLVKQQLAAGGGPDIIMTDGPTTLKQLAASGYLVDLEKYSQQFGWKDRFFEWSYNTVLHDGKLMGVPGSYETLVVYYNKDMFDKNGWEIPTSYEELISLAEKIDKEKIMPFAFGSSDFKASNEWWLSEAFNATLGPDEFKKVLTGEKQWNDEKMVDAITKLSDIWQKGYINKKLSHAISIDDAWNLFYSNKAAMKMEGTWGLQGIIDQNPDFQWDVFMLPAWSNGVEANLPLALGDATGINANSKHPDEVAVFIDYLFSVERAQHEVTRGAFYPVNGVDAASIEGLDPHIAKTYDMLSQAMAEKKTGYAAWTYWPPNTETYLWDNLDSVFLGQLSVENYLENAQKEADKDKADGKLFDFGQ